MTPDVLRKRTATARLVAVLLALALFELVIRQIYTESMVFEPGYRLIYEPGTTVRIAGEGHAVSSWSAHGVRGTRNVNSGQKSIIVVGDSYTEALMVDDHEVFTAIAEQVLLRNSAQIQVLNLGISGGSVADYAGFAPRYKSLFKPAWTVVQLRDTDLEADSFNQAKPHLVRDQVSGQLRPLIPARIEPSQSTGIRGRLKILKKKQPSKLLRYGYIRMHQLLGATRREPPLFRAGSAAAPARYTAKVSTEYPVEEQIRLVAATYENRVTFLYLPVLDPRSPAVETDVEKRFRKVCAADGLSCVDIRSTYPVLLQQGKSPFGFPNTGFNQGHMNALGHRLAGEALGAELVRLRRNAFF